MPPLPPIPPHYRFTRAELEVLECLADRKSYAETAEWLGVGLSTIATHVKHIVGKLPPGAGLRPTHRILHALWEWDLLARREGDTQKAA